jgi:O-antigen ligase
MRRATIEGWQEKLTGVLFALLLVSLPLTSFPYFPPALGGAAQVRPLALYPLFLLVLVATLPRLWRSHLPRPLLAFMAFVLLAVISTLLATFNGVEALRGVSLLERGARNLLTLGIGAALYLTVALLPTTADRLNSALRWLYIGMGAALAWGSLQIVYILYFVPQYFDLMNRLQRLISTRRLFNRRISGLTYEPNWFAEQISFLLLPWLLAAVISGQTVFKWRWRGVTVESVLLLWATVVLVFTYSRAGLFVLVMLLLTGLALARPRWPGMALNPSRGRRLLQQIVLAVVILAVLAGVLFAAGSQNNYFSRLWRFWTDPESGDSFLTYIAFSQRFTYWEAAYSMFAEQPLFGIGLGNFAFYFADHLPDQPLYRTPELLRQITPAEGRNTLVTPKNLHIKILAETGLIGMAAYLAFLLALAGCAVYLYSRAPAPARFWGRAAVLGLVAFAFAALSYDSFALPNMWVVFGLITAAARVYSGVEDSGS